MSRKYTRSEKESFLMDVCGYDQGYVEELDMTTLNELIEASQGEFEGYMS